MATAKNGETVAEPTKRQAIPKGIRKKLNLAFDYWAANSPGDEGASDAARKEVLAYINGLLKQLHA